MKVVLEINGRKKTFSNVESISILEEKTYDSAETASKPIEGKWFEVNPETINRELFKTKKKDERQEKTRQIILEAFDEVKNKPERYNKPFKTLIPEKTWGSKTVAQLKEVAKSHGDHMADWVEQALEWAQRISNGESWKAICNDADTANWYRLVVWKTGYVRLVGGAREYNSNAPVSDVFYYNYYSYGKLYNAVPLVVLYK